MTQIVKSNIQNLIYDVSQDQDEHKQIQSVVSTQKSDQKKNSQQAQIQQIRQQQKTIKIKVNPKDGIQIFKFDEDQYQNDQQKEQNDEQTQQNIIQKTIQTKSIALTQQFHKLKTPQSLIYNEQSQQNYKKFEQNDIQLCDSLRLYDIESSATRFQKSNQFVQQQKFNIQEQDQQSQEYQQSEDDQMLQDQQNQIKIVSVNKHEIMISTNLKHLIRKQVPIGLKISVSVKIQSKFMGLSTLYTLCHSQKVILQAKKQHFKLHSSFIICQSTRQITRRDKKYIGILQSNFSGTNYQLKYNHSQDDEQLLAKVQFNKNIMGAKGIRDMRVKIVDKTLGNLGKYQHQSKYQHQICLQQLMQRNQYSKISTYTTVQPKIQNNRFKLDFQGKAKIPSSKNIMLESKQKQQCFLMAKQSDNQFLIEIRYPFSIFEGFGFFLANLDSKLLVN